MGKTFGRIGGSFGGYSLECTFEDNRIRGRLGGAVAGNDINLLLSPEGDHLWGRVGGDVLGKDLNIALEKDRAYGRLGGKTIGDDISLQGTGMITGRVGGPVLGFSCRILVSADESKLTGRLGGRFIGANVNLTLESFPPMTASVLAATVYKIYLENTRSKAVGGKTGK
jgi:hypothetical protein